MTPRTRLAIPSVMLACHLFGAALALAQSSTAPATSPAASQPAPYKPTLMAHGTPNRIWIASVEQHREASKMGYKTVIRSQGLPADAWQELPLVFGHAVAITNLQTDLAVLLDDGNWKRVGVDAISTGPAVTVGAGPVLGWASTGQTLYAIRGVEGGKAGIESTTPNSPATRPTIPTTAATTTRATTTKPATPVLFRYERGQWTPISDLPSSTLGTPLALTIFNNRPVIAAKTAPGAVQAWIAIDAAWSDWGQARGQSGMGRFGLLSTPTSVALWTIDQDGGMELFLRSENESWAPSKNFNLPPGSPQNAQRALTVAGDEFRLILYSPGDSKFREARYDLSGAPRGGGGAVELPTPRPQQSTPLLWILQSVVLLIMVVVMLVTLYRRRNAQPQQQQDPGDDQ